MDKARFTFSVELETKMLPRDVATILATRFQQVVREEMQRPNLYGPYLLAESVSWERLDAGASRGF